MYFMDSSFHSNKPEQAKMIDISLYQHESSLSGGTSSTTAPFQNAYSSITMEAMRETIFRMAVMQPIHIDPETVKPPRRKNVRISRDPQSVAARHRRERISERMRTLQRMVPGGMKLDTASMLDEAVHYLKFLKKQVQLLESSRRVINGGWNHVSAGINYANA